MTLYSQVERGSLLVAGATGARAPGGRLAHGRLDVEFRADADARTYVDRQYATHPFHICRPHYHDPDLPGLATLYTQSCSGGLYEDDRLDTRIVAHPGAEAHVTSQASTIVHSMPAGSAVQSVRIEAFAGAYLEYLPDPQILFPNSRCSSTISADVCRGATVVLSDAFLLHDPNGADGVFATYFSEIVIRDETSRTLAIDRLRLTGRSLLDRHPGVTGAFAAQGTLVIAGQQELARDVITELRGINFNYGEAAIGFSLLPNVAGVIVRILAVDGATLRRAMHLNWCVMRLRLKGSVPPERRK